MPWGASTSGQWRCAMRRALAEVQRHYIINFLAWSTLPYHGKVTWSAETEGFSVDLQLFIEFLA